jgi:tape measure domain-containing protein
MSRRSNSSKQKSKAKSAPSSNGSSGLAVANTAQSISAHNEMLAASLLEAIKSVHEVDGVFSDYCSVNSAMLESVSATRSSLNDSASIATESMIADEAGVPCSSADAMATAVLEHIDADMDLDSDFGANIFADEEPVVDQPSSQAELSDTVIQELKASESQVWDEIRLEDCCFEDDPCFDEAATPEVATRQAEAVDPDDLVDDVLVGETTEACEFETDAEHSIDSSLDSSPISAIDAAVEILSQVVDVDDIPRIATLDVDQQIEIAQPPLAVPVDSTTGSLRGELKELTETLRSEFRQSLEALQASQAAANAAQSEVLKTLTEIMFQSAGSRDIPADAIEKAFSGVEERLMARLEAVAGNVAAPPNSSASSPGPIATRTGNGSPMKLQNAASSVSRSWEQIKSEMMNKGELTESSSAVKPQKPATALPEVAQLTSDRHFRLPEQDLSLEIPKAIDPETVSDQELRDAFREREAFITTLIARIRRQQESATGQLSAEQLRSLVEELPDELAEQVRHTLKQMDDLARMGELELSLERARIARQVNQLAHSRQLLERNARQMGMIVNADGTIVHGPNQAGRGSGSRRWLGKLGFGQ